MGRSSARARVRRPAKPCAIETHKDVRGYFRERLVSALRTRDVDAPEDVEMYLVHLLSGFAQVDTSELEGTLVDLQRRALSRRGRERYESLRRLGDRALYLSGFFHPSLERRGLTRRYYSDMGGRAYSAASNLAARSERAADRAKSGVLSDLAEHFPTYATVIDEVRETTALRTDDDVGDLLARYERSHSPAIGARLRARGIVPSWAPAPRGKGWEH